MTMPQQSQDKPDPKNILSEDQKQKQQATNRALCIDSYYQTAEATAKPHQTQD